MTEHRLTELLTDAAEQVPPPMLARTAWASARRLRRRRRVTGMSLAAAATATVVGATGMLAAGGGAPVTGLTSAPAASDTVISWPSPYPTQSPLAPNVDRLPGTLATATTSRLVADPPDLDASRVPGLSQRKGHAAIALYEPRPAEDADRPDDVYAWLDDGTWARIDQVRLRFARDEGGNRQSPLDNTSLSTGGQLAAFAQPDEVVVVAMATGAVSRIPLPGFNEHVIWRGEGLLFVGQDDATYRVDVVSRQYVEVPVSGWDLAANEDPAATVIELPKLNPNDGNMVLREYAPDGGTLLRTTPVNARAVVPHGIDEWYGRAWRRGDLVVRAGFGYSSVEAGEVVAVLNVRTGAIVRLLAAGRERWKGCCTPIGWLDADTVLLRVNPDGVVAWNIRTGAVAQVVRPFDGGIASASR